MRRIKLFENFSQNFKYVKFFEYGKEFFFKPITPNEYDYKLFEDFYKSLPDPMYNYLGQNCFDIESDSYYGDSGYVDYDYATNGDDLWYCDIYKYSETGEDVDSFEALYVILLVPKDGDDNDSCQIECDGEDGLRELIHYFSKFSKDENNNELFKSLRSFV